MFNKIRYLLVIFPLIASSTLHFQYLLELSKEFIIIWIIIQAFLAVKNLLVLYRYDYEFIFIISISFILFHEYMNIYLLFLSTWLIKEYLIIKFNKLYSSKNSILINIFYKLSDSLSLLFITFFNQYYFLILFFSILLLIPKKSLCYKLFNYEILDSQLPQCNNKIIWIMFSSTFIGTAILLKLLTQNKLLISLYLFTNVIGILISPLFFYYLKQFKSNNVFLIITLLKSFFYLWILIYPSIIPFTFLGIIIGLSTNYCRNLINVYSTFDSINYEMINKLSNIFIPLLLLTLNINAVIAYLILIVLISIIWLRNNNS